MEVDGKPRFRPFSTGGVHSTSIPGSVRGQDLLCAIYKYHDVPLLFRVAWHAGHGVLQGREHMMYPESCLWGQGINPGATPPPDCCLRLQCNSLGPPGSN